MNTTPSQTSDEDLVAKYKRPLQDSIEKLSTEVASYNFKPIENHFFETNLGKTIKVLNWFTILSIGHRFFYTDKNTKATYITDVIVDKSETLSFSKDKSKYKLFWQEKFTFDELEKKSFEIGSWVNRKIILFWVFDWKLTKLEASVISERNILSYVKNNENEPTADICWTEKVYKDNVTSVLSLVKSKKPQLNLSESDELQYLQELDTHITTTNKNLYISWNTVLEPKKDVVSEVTNLSQEELQATLSVSNTQNVEVIEDKIEDSTETSTENSTNDPVYEIPSENLEEIVSENTIESSETNSENAPEIIKPNFDFTTSSEG